MISHTNAIVDPNAMMIKPRNATLTEGAMLGSCGLDQITGATMPHVKDHLIPLPDIAEFVYILRRHCARIRGTGSPPHSQAQGKYDEADVFVDVANEPIWQMRMAV